MNPLLLNLKPLTTSSTTDNPTREEQFRILKKLTHVSIGINQFERMIAIRVKNGQIVCILKDVTPGKSDWQDYLRSDNFVMDHMQTPLVRMFKTDNFEYIGDENNTIHVVMNCLLKERLSKFKVERVSHLIILQIIYQYMEVMRRMDEYFQKPYHERKCNRPEIAVDRFNKETGRIKLVFSATDSESENVNLVELSEHICTGRNEFEKEMVFEIVEFLTQQNLQKDLDTRALFGRLSRTLETNEFSTQYLDAFKIITNGGSNALNKLKKSSLFSGESIDLESFGSFYNSLCESIKSSKQLFIDFVKLHSSRIPNIPGSLSCDKDVLKILVEQNPLNIQLVETEKIQDDRQFIMELVDINPMVLYHAYWENLGRDEELWIKAIEKNPISLMGYYREHDLESETFKQKLKEIAIEHGYLLTRCDLIDLFENDRDSVLKLLSKYGFAYSRIPSHMKNDRELVKVAVSNCGYVLMHLPPELRNDKEIVMMALAENKSAYGSVGQDLKSDPDVLLAAKNLESDLLDL